MNLLLKKLTLSETQTKIIDFFLKNKGQSFTKEELVKHYKELGYNYSNRYKILKDIYYKQIFEIFLYAGYLFFQVPEFECYQLQKIEKPMSNQTKDLNALLCDYEQGESITTYFNNQRLLSTKKALVSLFKKKGINPLTVAKVELGIDDEGVWWFPNYKYSTGERLDLVGFEFLPANLDESRWYRNKAMPSMLLAVNRYTQKTTSLVLVKDHIDAYTMWQYLNENSMAPYYQVVMPVNNLKTLTDCIGKIEFDKYKDFYLFLGNSEVARDVTDDIIIRYPEFKNLHKPCSCASFNEYYLKYVKARE